MVILQDGEMTGKVDKIGRFGAVLVRFRRTHPLVCYRARGAGSRREISGRGGETLVL